MLEAIWVFLGLIIVSGLMYALATYVFGRGEELAPMPPDATPMVLPSTRDLSGDDLREVRLPVSVRGYRMSDVDDLLDRISEELDRRDRGQLNYLPAAPTVLGVPMLPSTDDAASGASEGLEQSWAPAVSAVHGTDTDAVVADGCTRVDAEADAQPRTDP